MTIDNIGSEEMMDCPVMIVALCISKSPFPLKHPWYDTICTKGVFDLIKHEQMDPLLLLCDMGS